MGHYAMPMTDNPFRCATDTIASLQDEEIKNIFIPFYRSNNHERINGHGLGLSIAKNMLEKHVGNIQCESLKRTRGLRFNISLPKGAY